MFQDVKTVSNKIKRQYYCDIVTESKSFDGFVDINFGYLMTSAEIGTILKKVKFKINKNK